MALNITIQTIPHAEQRYDTTGDYYEKDGVLNFRISALKDWRFEALIAVHELIERLLCQQAGIIDADIDKFDLLYEELRKANFPVEVEPGDDLAAPYYRQHQFATKIEKMLAKELGVDWKEYEDYIYNEVGSR